MIERRCNVEEWLSSLEDKTVVGFVNKSSQNLSLCSYIYNAFELLARLLEEWSSVTRLWVEKIWSSVSGYISIRQISVDTWEYWTRWYWSLALEGLKQARLLSVELRKLLALQVHHHVLISGRWGTIKSTNKHSTSYLKYKSLYCKNIPIQLNFWNGLLFPTHMYVSTLNQKVICRYCENKNNKVSGPVCCLIPGADTIYFCLK